MEIYKKQQQQWSRQSEIKKQGDQKTHRLPPNHPQQTHRLKDDPTPHSVQLVATLMCVCVWGGGGGGAQGFSTRDVTAENVVLAGSRFVHPSIDLYIELILVYVSSIMPPSPYVCKIVYVMV